MIFATINCRTPMPDLLVFAAQNLFDDASFSGSLPRAHGREKIVGVSLSLADCLLAKTVPAL